jgi:peroxidase
MTSNQNAANKELPSPSSNLDTLIARFLDKGFNTGEMVALSGAHTIGVARCQFNQARCPIGATTAPLDEKTPTVFDNRYYANLLANRGLLQSDQVLTSRIDVKPFVDDYNSNEDRFFQDFTSAMTKMSELGVLTGTNGQVRTKCNRLN